MIFLSFIIDFIILDLLIFSIAIKGFFEITIFFHLLLNGCFIAFILSRKVM